MDPLLIFPCLLMGSSHMDGHSAGGEQPPGGRAGSLSKSYSIRCIDPMTLTTTTMLHSLMRNRSISFASLSSSSPNLFLLLPPSFPHMYGQLLSTETTPQSITYMKLCQ